MIIQFGECKSLEKVKDMTYNSNNSFILDSWSLSQVQLHNTRAQ